MGGTAPRDVLEIDRDILDYHKVRGRWGAPLYSGGSGLRKAGDEQRVGPSGPVRIVP